VPSEQISQPVPGLDSAPAASSGALIWRMLKLAWRTPRRCLTVLFLRLLLLAVMLGGLGLTGLGIDIIRHGRGEIAQRPVVEPLGVAMPTHWTPDLGVLVAAVGIILLAAARGGLFYISETITADLVHRNLVVQLRATVYDKLQRLSFRFYDANNSGSIINRVTSDCRLVGNFVQTVGFRSIELLLTIVVMLVYMLLISVKLTVVCLITLPVMLGMAIVFGRIVKPAYRKNRRLVDKLILKLTEYLRGIHVVKGFSSQDDQVRQFGERNASVRQQAEWIYWRLTVFQPFIGMMGQINMILLLSFGGYMVIKGELALGTGLVVFAGLLEQFSQQINILANVTNSIQISLTSSQRVFEVLDAPLEIESKPDATHVDRARGGVRFENVSFGYTAEEPVLQEINFEVLPGACVAVLGATGAGKSTLLSLIPRFYDPLEGRILIDNMDLCDLDLDDLRRNIGLVFQENFLFSNTVAQNIAFGHPQATQQQIEKAARVAAAHEFIMELPNGYDTVIGEGGGDLSGGQRQRLAIARAVLLEPAILILDDATAAVDPQTEHEILEAMDNAMQGRTTFVVAHRLSTLRRADMVLVLEKGRIVQAGTHDQLMTTTGHYRQAAKLQVADAESRRLLGLG